jgi:two-component system invasion response regulator UvrY
MDNIKVMVVDDQHLVRTGLVHMLANITGLEIVAEADSGEDALQKITQLIKRQQKPDVLLMDLLMPGMGGMEATRIMVHRHPSIKIIAVTGCTGTPFPQRFLDSGVVGFITKESGIDELVKAIRLVQRGKCYISHDIAQDLALNVVKHESNKSPFECLSERELQIALMVMDSVKTTHIAESLNVSPKTVHTYRYRLFEKLNINSNVELALLAYRHGLLQQNPAEI